LQDDLAEAAQQRAQCIEWFFLERCGHGAIPFQLT
jgi:hypothetical protein